MTTTYYQRFLSTEERFWAMVKIRILGCWEWQAGKDTKGYGHFSIKKSGRAHTRAHRISWELKHGPIPDGMQVLHKCDNPACVKPSHLFLGDHSDNMKDSRIKGRQKGKTKGSINGRAILTEKEVKQIRKYFAEEKITPSQLSEKYGVSSGQIRKIVGNRAWRKGNERAPRLHRTTKAMATSTYSVNQHRQW